MQRYEISNPYTRATLRIRYIGGVGAYDVFWIAEFRRLVVKWHSDLGYTCAVTKDGAEELSPLKTINECLKYRSGPAMTEEEYEVLRAMRKLFVVE